MAEILYKDLSFEVVGAAMEVHRELGPGFQVHHYLAGTGYRLGIILNFGADTMGMKRIAK